MFNLYKFKPSAGSLKLIAPCCPLRFPTILLIVALVVQTTLAEATTATTTSDSQRIVRANQQQQQTPPLDVDQQLSPAAAPFYSIKDSKTSARRIQKQQQQPSGPLAVVDLNQIKPGKLKQPPPATSNAKQQQQQQLNCDGTNCNQAQSSSLSRPSSKLAANIQNASAADSGEQQQQAQLLDLFDGNFAANELRDQDIGGVPMADNLENDNNQVSQSTGVRSGGEKQRQQMVNSMIDSFNQLVGSGQLDSLMSSFRGNSNAGSQLDAATTQRQLQQFDDQLGTTENSVAANQVDSLAGNQQVTDSPTKQEERKSSATKSSKQSLGGKTKSIGGQKVLRPNENNAAVGSDDSGTSQSSSSTPSSLSMSLDEMIVNSRPRATSSSSKSIGKQQRLGDLKLSRTGRPEGDTSDESTTFANNDNNNNNIRLNSTQLSPNGKAPRRVPFSGVPFSSPASKGQRTKPKASNQFGDGSFSSANQISSDNDNNLLFQQQQKETSSDSTIDEAGLQQPTTALNNGQFDGQTLSLDSTTGGQLPARQPKLQSVAIKTASKGKQQASGKLAGKNTTLESNNNRNAKQPRQQQATRLDTFNNQQQQQQQTSGDQLDANDDQVSLTQQQQFRQQEDRLPSDDLDNSSRLVSSLMDSFSRNGSTVTAFTTSNDMQPKLATTDENGGAGEMLMSVVSSQDGKERRLVMISRDTLNTLQKFAVQQMNAGAGQVSTSSIIGQQLNSLPPPPAVTNGQPGAADSSLISGPANSWLGSSSEDSFNSNNADLQQQRQAVPTAELDSFQNNFSGTSFASADSTTTTTVAPRTSTTTATTTTTTATDSSTKSTAGDFQSSTFALTNSGEATTSTSFAATSPSTPSVESASSFLEVPVQQKPRKSPQTGQLLEPNSNQKKGKTGGQKKQSTSPGSAKTKQQQAAASGNSKAAQRQQTSDKQQKTDNNAEAGQRQQQQSQSVNKQANTPSGDNRAQSGQAPSSPQAKVKSSSNAANGGGGGSGATKSGNNNRGGAKQQQHKAQSTATTTTKQNNGTNNKQNRKPNGAETDSVGTNRKTKTSADSSGGNTGEQQQQQATRSPISIDEFRQKQSSSLSSNGPNRGDQVGQKDAAAAVAAQVGAQTSGTRNGQQASGQQQQRSSSTSTKTSAQRANSIQQQPQQKVNEGDSFGAAGAVSSSRPPTASTSDAASGRADQQSFPVGQLRPQTLQLNRTVLAAMSKLEIDKHLDELERNGGGGSENNDNATQDSDTNRPTGQKFVGQRAPVGQDNLAVSSLGQLDNLEALKAAIPGEPLLDYPIYSAPPKTNFDCQAQSCPGGYYADLDSQCQVFHVCQNDGRFDTFLCPNGTIFSQQHFVCVWWWQVDCQQSRSFYNLNDAIYCNPMNLPPGSSSQWTMKPQQQQPTADGQLAGFNVASESPRQQATGATRGGQSSSPQLSNVGLNSSDNSDLPRATTSTSGDSSASGTGDATTTPTATTSTSSQLTTANSLAKLLPPSGSDDARTSTTTTTTTSTTSTTAASQGSRNKQQKQSSGDSLSESDLNEQQQQQLELLSRRA